MHDQRTGTRQEWLAARLELLEREKAHTRERDALRAARMALPWVRIEKEYVFEGPEGRLGFGGLFEGRSQLIVQHFMFGPGWAEGCVGCSLTADHVDGALQHLRHHDVAFVAVSRAPWAEIAPFKARMAWRFPWVSSFGSGFNADFGVAFTREQLAQGKGVYNYRESDPGMEELSGTSAFFRDADGSIFHTYSTYARGDEQMIGAYHYLDIAPLGRNETGRGDLMDWVRHHDRYDDGSAGPRSCCGSS